MLVSKSWLKDYIDIPKISDQEIAEVFTLHTAEVEEVKHIGGHLEKIVVGEVTEVKIHPDADKLKVVETKISESKNVEIVCGGINLKKGMKVAVALPGAKVIWHGKGEPVEMKLTKIRGVESHGMICASEEIGLADQFKAKEIREIMDISFLKSPVGTPLKQALGLDDVIFDIENKSITHRPDLWGHYGIAREMSVLFNTPLVEIELPHIVEGHKQLRVSIKEEGLCKRYIGIQMDNVDVQTSPEYIAKRIRACGIRSINTIVDITNYILLELGQPMHAFDAKKVRGNIVVRKARAGEKLQALDENIYELRPDDLVIADDDGCLAIAGVMGGLRSAVTQKTSSIIFEAANFDAATVRKTSVRLGLRSESSARFEKSLDPTGCETAIKRAVQLVKEFCKNATVASNIADEGTYRKKEGLVETTYDFINQKIGINIAPEEIDSILKKLGFRVQENGRTIAITVPTWRATKDITLPEDIAEEVARIYGYGNVTEKMPSLNISPPPVNPIRNLERKVRNYFTYSAGMTEICSYSFVSEKQIQNLGNTFSTEKHLELLHPISKERPYLRQSLLPGLFESMEKNITANDSIFLYEIGTVFFPELTGPLEKPKGGNLPGQRLHAAIGIYQKGNTNPYPLAFGVFSGLLIELGFTYEVKKPTEAKPFLHPNRQSELHVHGQRVAFVGEVHPDILKNFGIKERISVAKINLTKLADKKPAFTKYKKISDFPTALRDIAFLVDEKTELEKIKNEILKVSPLVCEAEVFDIYRGKNLGENKKSMAFHLKYQSDTKTLTTEDVDTVHKEVIDLLEKKFGAHVR